jgi:triacylglycerol lipase
LPRLPVILVPGWSDRSRAVRHLKDRLVDAGWPADQVTAIEFRDRYGSNREHAAEIAQHLRRLAVHEHFKVDIVAHSMGGLAVRYLLRHLPEGTFIRRVIFLGTPHRGTLAAYLAWGAGASEMRRGSEFLRELEGSPVNHSELISLHTPLDLRLFPGSTGRLAGSRSLRIWCLGHRGLLRSRRVFAAVKHFLETD